jgi:hypothetical protein
LGKLALAMQEAHKKKVVHGDLKPANIMITAGGQADPVIVDFGQMPFRSAREARLATGKPTDAIAYMAPEQVRGAAKQTTPASDVYALGVILYEQLTGQVPFSGEGLEVASQILTGSPVPPSKHRSDLDLDLDAICLKAMARQVGERYPSMGEFAAALTTYLRSLPPAAASPPPRPASATPTSPAARGPADDRLSGVKASDQLGTGRTSPLPGSSAQPAVSVATMPTRRRLRWPFVVAAALVGAVLLGVVIYVATNKGRITLVVNDPNAVVKVDGDVVRIESLGEPITLRAGDHDLEVKWGNGELRTGTFTLNRGGDKLVEVYYEPFRDIKITDRKQPAPVPNTEIGGSESESSPGGAEPRANAPLPVGKDAFAELSVWKGPYSIEASNIRGRMEFYVQSRADRNYTAIFVARADASKPGRLMSWVEGTVSEGALVCQPQDPGARFSVRGSFNGDVLEAVFTGPDGNVARASLKREAGKPESAKVVFSVFRKNDTDGWYTKNQDGTLNATQPLTVNSIDGVYWVLAPSNRNPNEFGWHAPAKYHGDHSGKYGHWLIYTLRSTAVRRPPPPTGMSGCAGREWRSSSMAMISSHLPQDCCQRRTASDWMHRRDGRSSQRDSSQMKQTSGAPWRRWRT